MIIMYIRFLYRFFSIDNIHSISIDKIKSFSKSSGLSKEYFICYSHPCTGPDINFLQWLIGAYMYTVHVYTLYNIGFS